MIGAGDGGGRRDKRAGRGAPGLALALAAALLAGAGAARAQVSPGPLATAHRALDTPTGCFQCHPKGGGGPAAMDKACLACHTEIAWTRAQRRGLHARTGAVACASCHPDHGGRDFAMIEWPDGTAGRFDHRRAGWALEGSHAKLECRACHQPRLRRSAVAARTRVPAARSWLGLETSCASCHADPHRNQLGADCARCHDAAKWDPAPRFDHAKTRYPLTGAHAKLECAACHLAPKVAGRAADGAALAQWKPLPHAQCSSCHSDPHAGRFGADCSGCHVTSDFHTVSGKRFDHDRTRYPLRGRHAAVACASCHDARTAFGARPRFGACGDCHRDPHGNQLAAVGDGGGGDCATCHDVRGFRPSIWPLAAHQHTGFPLTGAHARADCAQCHAKQPAAAAAALGPARVPLHPAAGECVDCHHDPHQGRFARGGERARNDGCLACHDRERFRPSTLDAAAHEQCAYPLEGGHRAVPCAACHAELAKAPARSSLRGAAAGARPLGFEDARRRCAECHRTPHGRQFDARADKGACETCHGLEAFAPATRFDHGRHAAFKLEGAHARTACESCHRREPAEGGGTRVVWRPLSARCESCHTGGEGRSTGAGGSSMLLLTTHPAGSS